MRKKNLVTAALPYVNNIPHLGNLIQVLSADAFARYSRMDGIETLYICGTDEYGTATETKALIEKITPKELCDRYHSIHKKIYEWFNIQFDAFGRTTNEHHKETVQNLFLKLDANGYINEKETEQFFCETDNMFLADRYVIGICPNCGIDAKGDQCENCSKLLNPTDLINPKCIICKNSPALRKTKNLYLDLPKIQPELEAWIKEISQNENWNTNSIKMTNAFLRDGLKERAITRDLKWGIPVPKLGFENKVFYVWFDAPIGYISITKEFTKDWESWWKDRENVNLVQFIGKDNILFHTVVFPSVELGSNEQWTMLSQMASTEYLNYENLKFSKSKGTGIFGNDARDTGIEADIWRFYIYYNRPEKSDFQFLWEDFMERVNSELIGNFSNLVNRVLTFYKKFFGNEVDESNFDPEFFKDINTKYKNTLKFFEKAELKNALKEVLEISAIGNKTFQDKEPWKTKDTNKEATKTLLINLIYLIRDLSILLSPFIPETSEKIRKFFNKTYEISTKYLGTSKGIEKIEHTEILFNKLEKDLILNLKEKYSGGKKMEEQIKDATPENIFSEKVYLKVVKVVKIERNPEAEKLFILKLDDGTEQGKQIVSALADYYKEEEILDKHIIIVDNLKPAKFRGIPSNGMLISTEDRNDSNKFRVIIVDDSIENPSPGDRVILETDYSTELPYPSKISKDKFLKSEIVSENGELKVNGINLVLQSSKEKVLSKEIKDGIVW